MLKRAGFLALIGVFLPLSVPLSPAAADGSVVCSEALGGCVIVAEDSSSSGGSSTPGNTGAAVSEAEGQTIEPECEVGEDSAICVGSAASSGTAAPAVSPVQVAAQAIEMLPLPAPEIGLAPNPPSTALVGSPVWLWVDNQTWTAASRTATAGSISVTATATPDRVEWSMGDGSSVTCYNAGRPYTRGTSSSCTHTYVSSSRSGPYTITATVYWDISWSGGGASGGQTLSQSSTASLGVREAQAIVQ
ncbi:hypothetical protein GCM10009642_37120 [Nocardiopsis metallicus]